MEADLSLAIGDRGLRSFALAFAITQLVEVPFYARALRAKPAPAPALAPSIPPQKQPRSLATRALVGFGASAITHPIVWFWMPGAAVALYSVLLRAGAPALGLMGRTLFYGAVAESFAILAEALYLRAFGVRRALRWSIAANAASVIVGTIVVRFA